MKTKKFFAVLAVLGLLVSCASMKPHPMDMTQAVLNAKSAADHDALARHYDDAAKEMQKRADEHKKLLEEYESKSYHYGKQAQELQAHCRGLIRYYEQAAKANAGMAKAHREIAAAMK